MSASVHAGGDYEVVLRMDDDDPELDQCVKIAERFGANVIVGERCILSDMWSECADAATGDILWLQDDEIVFISDDWVDVIESFFGQYPDNLLVGGADESHGGQHFCTPIMTRRWYEVTGHTYPRGFDGDWGDVWICDVARYVGRWFFVPGLIVNQLAAAKGMAPQDETWASRRARHEAQDTRKLFLDRGDERMTEVHRLRPLLNTEPAPT